MPEYSSIQTHAVVDDESLEPTLRRFSNLLDALGLLAEDVRHALASFAWSPVESGFVYSTQIAPKPLLLGTATVRCRPLLMGIAPQVSKLPHRTIALELLFETEQITIGGSRNYVAGVGRPLYDLCLAVGAVNPRAGVFLCDEAQDGQPWHWLAERRSEQQWQFDMAFVPGEISDDYASPPVEFWSAQLRNGVAFASKHAFVSEPWR